MDASQLDLSDEGEKRFASDTQSLTDSIARANEEGRRIAVKSKKTRTEEEIDKGNLGFSGLTDQEIAENKKADIVDAKRRVRLYSEYLRN